MFERFTQAARAAVLRAQQEARQQGSPTVGAEHLLIGVVADAEGGPATVLRRWGVDAARLAAATGRAADLDDEALSALGIDLDEVRRRTEDAFGRGALDRPVSRPRGLRGLTQGHLPLTSEAKAVLVESLRAAVAGQDREIGSTQLFLGLLAVEEGTALRVLRRLGVSASREELRRLVQAEHDQAA